jgi:hypothetical protein
MSHRLSALVAPSVLALAVVASSLVPACKKTGVARVGALRDALASDDAGDVESLSKDTPPCVEEAVGTNAAPQVPAPCLGELAKSFGATAGYVEDPPDQASAGAAVISVLRDKRGDRMGHPEAWLASVAKGKGTGADALRLAVARGMRGPLEELAGLPPSSEDKARRLMKAVAASLPGACTTYARLGGGAKNEDLPLTLSAEHAPCVNKDLGRSQGPGPGYGQGVPRAAEGALALWKEYLGALEAGAALMEPKSKQRLQADLPKLRELTSGFALEKVAAPTGNAWAQQSGVEHLDAGMPGPPTTGDAGPSTVEAGAPRPRPKP